MGSHMLLRHLRCLQHSVYGEDKVMPVRSVLGVSPGGLKESVYFIKSQPWLVLVVQEIRDG